MKDRLLAALSATILLAVMGLIGYQWTSCSEAGGDFVRGVIWFKCLK